MLVEIAIGDAYGAGFEFVSAEDRRSRPADLRCYYPHPKASVGGRYTDDTQMSLALSEAILDRSEAWTKESIATRFVDAYRADPRSGYSSRVGGALATSSSGEELLERLDAQATSCGAAMRSVPLGWLPDANVVRRIASLQASVTHDTEAGRQSSIAVGLAAHHLRTGGSLADLDEYLASEGTEARFLAEWPQSEAVPNDALACVRAALSCLRGTRSLADCLVGAVGLLGDVDSVAAIAVGLASLAADEVEADLPTALYDGLEDGARGRSHLARVDARLRETR